MDIAVTPGCPLPFQTAPLSHPPNLLFREESSVMESSKTRILYICAAAACTGLAVWLLLNGGAVTRSARPLTAREYHQQIINREGRAVSSRSPASRKRVAVARAEYVPQEEVFGSGNDDALPAEVVASLGLTPEQAAVWTREMKLLRSKMTEEARKHTSRDETASTENRDVFVVDPFQEEAAALRGEFVSKLGLELSPALVAKLSERYNWVSYFGNYGATRTVLEFYEEELEGRSFLMYQSTSYDPGSGEKIREGISDYEGIQTHWGGLFGVTDGGSQLGVKN